MKLFINGHGRKRERIENAKDVDALVRSSVLGNVRMQKNHEKMQDSLKIITRFEN